MTIHEFRQSFTGDQPPAGSDPLLTALWYTAKGEWERAHRIAQEEESADGAWLHAHLHRREGDAGNAMYWYRRAGRPVCRSSFDDEFLEITEVLLRNQP